MKLWRLILRLTVGFLFVGHGTQKLFGWFEGDGLEQTGEVMEKVGLRPGREHAMAAGLAEAGGGALLFAGAAMPVAGAALTGAMLTAIKRVHLKNGLWTTKGGSEYPLALILVVLGLVESGPGALSVDRLLGSKRTGAGWAAMAFGAGALGAFAVEQLAGRDLPSPLAWLEHHDPAAPQRAAA